jgi:hypothetical protein
MLTGNQPATHVKLNLAVTGESLPQQNGRMYMLQEAGGVAGPLPGALI